MAARGPYAKGITKREEILDAAVSLIAKNGYSKTTVRDLASAVGLSQNGLLHYFGSKDALFTEVLTRRDNRNAIPHVDGEPTDVAAYTALLRDDAEVAGLVQLYAVLSNEATDVDHPSHEYFSKRFQLLSEVGTRFFDDLKAQGKLAPGADSATLAVLMFSALHGLQTRWLYERELDLTEHFDYFLDVIIAGEEARRSSRDSGDAAPA